MPIRRASAAFLVALLLATAAAGKPPPRPPALEAVRTDQAPRIDAVLDEAAWAGAAVVDDFTMQLPQGVLCV